MLKHISAFLACGAAYLGATAPAAADPVSIGSFIISSFLTAGLGGVLPAVSAALIGNVVLGAAAIGSMLIQSAMMRRPSIQPQEFKNVFRSGNDTSEVRAIGRVRVGGLVAFGNTKGLDRYRLICHTKGLWTATEEHYLGGRDVVVEDDGWVSSPPWSTLSGSNVRIQSKVGTGSETSWADLQSTFPDLWTAEHRVRGIHQSLVKYISPGFNSESAIKRHQLLFQSGEPPYEKVGRAEPIFDPRDVGQSPTNAGTWAWSDNGVLGAAHILRSFPSINAADLDYDAIADEADRADAVVATLTGSEVRSRSWGFWTSESSRGDIMEQVLSSIGAEIVPSDDQRYTIRLVEDDPQAEITFYEQHVIDIDYASGPESVQRPNVCRVKYYSPERNFDFADIDLSAVPWSKIQDEIDRTGEQIETIELPFCPSSSQAQRIGRRLFALKRADAGIMRLNYAGVAAWGKTIANLPFPNIGPDGATLWKKCAIGSPRINDGEGIVELPFVVWPDLPDWDPETMEAPAPEPIPDLQYPSELDKPAMPADAVQVIYPDNSREVRMRFAGVTGGTVAEATRRNWASGSPNPWAAMTEYQSSGNWYAWAAADWEGQDADFRVRFFNAEEEGSYWSDTLEKRPLLVDNSAGAAPTVTTSGTGTRPILTASTTNLNVATLLFEYSSSDAAPVIPWTTLAQPKARPGDEHSAEMPPLDGGSSGRTVNWRVSSVSSNGTVGTYATGSYFIAPPDTGP